MKPLYILILLIISTPFYSTAQLDEEHWGRYSGEIPSYTTLINDSEVLIKSQDITVSIEDGILTYQLSGVALKGKYVILEDKRKECILEGEVSNGRSLHLKLSLRLNKKRNKLYLDPIKDQPEAELVLLDED